MGALHTGEFSTELTNSDLPQDLAAIAEAVRAHLVDALMARPTDVMITVEPSSHSVAFSFPGRLTGTVRVSGPRAFALSYIVANMWEYRETADFDSYAELCSFLARLIRLVQRFSHAAFGTTG